MQTRHRTPTIFNLSMVDVLCCALGCVILLWLLNLREAKQRAAAAGEASQLLASTRAQLDVAAENAAMNQMRLELTEEEARRVAALLAATRGERDLAIQQAEAALQDRAQVRRDLDAARSRLAELDKQVTASKQRTAKAESTTSELNKQL